MHLDVDLALGRILEQREVRRAVLLVRRPLERREPLRAQVAGSTRHTAVAIGAKRGAIPNRTCNTFLNYSRSYLRN